jgi:tRNA threonylcarbamoyladenosine biosynthesis protein TsaE
VVGDVIALEGELGAGKTQFVRGLAEGLGLDARQVSSPTFVMVQEYDVPAHAPAEHADNGETVLIHIDAYRLRSADDRASIGWEGDGGSMREGAVVAIEWASLMGEALPSDRLDVRIEHEPEGRLIALLAQGQWRARMQKVADAIRSRPPA